MIFFDTICIALCRTLYWTDYSPSRPAIYRSSVVNPARETLVSGDLVWPHALAVDFIGKQAAIAYGWHKVQHWSVYLKMIDKGFVLFKIKSSPSTFYIIKPTCISWLVFEVSNYFLKIVETFIPESLFTLSSDDVISGQNQNIQLVCVESGVKFNIWAAVSAV